MKDSIQIMHIKLLQVWPKICMHAHTTMYYRGMAGFFKSIIMLIHCVINNICSFIASSMYLVETLCSICRQKVIYDLVSTQLFSLNMTVAEAEKENSVKQKQVFIKTTCNI